MADYAQFKFGGATYPLTSSLANPLLRDADPSLWYAIEYFASVITTHVEARLLAECAQAPAIAAITKAVAYVTSVDPTVVLLESQVQFPLLSVYRRSDEYDQRTLAYDHATSEWGVEFVLPPLSPAQYERVYPILKAVRDTLLDRIENTFDPGYQNGAKVWQLAQLESVRLTKGRFGSYDHDTGNLVFPAFMGTLLVKERQMPLEAQFEKLSGVDIVVDAASSIGPSILDIVDAQVTYPDPSTFSSAASVVRSDAGATPSPTDGFRLATWADQGPLGINYAPRAAAPAIQYGTVYVGGTPKAVIRFDALSQTCMQSIAASTMAVDTGKTLIVLARMLATSTRAVVFAQTAPGDTGASTIAIEANTVSTTGGRFGLYANGSSYDTVISVDTAWHVFALRLTSTTNGAAIAGNVDFHIDGSPALTLTNRSGSGLFQGMTTSNLLTLGANPALLSTTAGSIDVAVAMAFSSRLSDTILASATTYCKQWLGQF